LLQLDFSDLFKHGVIVIYFRDPLDVSYEVVAEQICKADQVVSARQSVPSEGIVARKQKVA
jgi:hypothetical protein